MRLHPNPHPTSIPSHPIAIPSPSLWWTYGACRDTHCPPTAASLCAAGTA